MILTPDNRGEYGPCRVYGRPPLCRNYVLLNWRGTLAREKVVYQHPRSFHLMPDYRIENRRAHVNGGSEFKKRPFELKVVL